MYCRRGVLTCGCCQSVSHLHGVCRSGRHLFRKDRSVRSWHVTAAALLACVDEGVRGILGWGFDEEGGWGDDM